jgi:GT2 family glycosyltransferase
LVQATALFEGHERTIEQPDWTASAGAAIAVDREKFLELGGFDPLYLPGRLEDLDFCYRGYQRGWHALYVPAAVAFHRGAASFQKVYTPSECERLALRNTLLFQWKNLRHPWHLGRHACGLMARLIWDIFRAPTSPAPPGQRGSLGREWEFFRRFAPPRLALEVSPERQVCKEAA